MKPRYHKQTSHFSLLNPKQALFIKEKILKPHGEIEEITYTLIALLGRGETARVYEVNREKTGERFAMKIVPKNLGEECLRDEASLKQRIVREISIQKSLDHPNILGLKHAFEDQDNVYILLELCSKETLKDLVKNVGILSEDLTKRYIIQLANALKYLHSKKIIHRDVKLTNLFLTKKMDLKLGDFGLSIRLNSVNDQRFTICGTPDYVAPEVIKKSGYSYEADIWSLGVVAYHLLIGRLPFENPDNRIVMKKIMERNFSFPEDVVISPAAKHFITTILVLQPEKRPTLDQILVHPFLDSASYALQPTILLTPPTDIVEEKLVVEENLPVIVNLSKANSKKRSSGGSSSSDRQKYMSPDLETKRSTIVARNLSFTPGQSRKNPIYLSFDDEEEKQNRRKSIFQHLSRNPKSRKPRENEKNNNLTPPPIEPFSGSFSSIKKGMPTVLVIDEVFVLKWLDYNSKYGMGYSLSNGLTGVIFTDGTQVFSFSNHKSGNFQYFDPKLKNSENSVPYSFQKYPQNLEKKIKLYFYFQEYLAKNRSGVSMISSTFINIDKENMNHQSSELLPVFICKWMKTEQAIFFKLSNKIVQVVFKDGAMLIVNPYQDTTKYINKNGEMNLKTIECSEGPDVDEMLKRVSYVKNELDEAWRTLNTE